MAEAWSTVAQATSSSADGSTVDQDDLRAMRQLLMRPSRRRAQIGFGVGVGVRSEGGLAVSALAQPFADLARLNSFVRRPLHAAPLLRSTLFHRNAGRQEWQSAPLPRRPASPLRHLRRFGQSRLRHCFARLVRRSAAIGACMPLSATYDQPAPANRTCSGDRAG